MDHPAFTGWRKSSRSAGGANCVEFAAAPDAVGLRDSKDPVGAVLAFPIDGWRDFVAGVHNGEFDLPHGS